MIELNKFEAIANWLTAGAPPHTDLTEIVADYARRLAVSGMPLDQFSITQTMIHPQLPGRMHFWTARAGVRIRVVDANYYFSTDWTGLPAAACMTTGRLVRHVLGKDPQFDASAGAEGLQKRGYTEFIYAPLHSTHTLKTNVAAYATKLGAGFSDDDIGVIKRLQAPLARVVEASILHDSTVQILSTYVGRDAGDRVLAGNIVRGDTEVISAVVLFIDLNGFTRLSNQQPAQLVIETLNHFYDAVEPAIRANGGEILKFMGDGLLAIFPTPDDQTAQMAAAVGAIMALEQAQESLMAANAETPDLPQCSFRAALHLGDIHYGNVGSLSRLDFTAIGPTVNFASRMIDYSSEIGAEVVCSDTFRALLPDLNTTEHQVELKGFDGANAIHVLS